MMAAELDALGKVLSTPSRPAVAIVGGSKVSTKLSVLTELANRVDKIVVGGGMANTFLAAAGFCVGQSLMEPDLLERGIIDVEVDIPLPTDVVVATAFSADADAIVKQVDEVAEADLILDVGPETQASYQGMMASASTILWNGPVGVFEFPKFEGGTRALSLAIARATDSISLAVATPWPRLISLLLPIRLVISRLVAARSSNL